MKKLLIAAGLSLLCMQSAFAQSAFCAGFAEGYKMIKGEMALVPICPIEPITPIGSTPFREGVKAGMAAAYRY